MNSLMPLGVVQGTVGFAKKTMECPNPGGPERGSGEKGKYTRTCVLLEDCHQKGDI